MRLATFCFVVAGLAGLAGMCLGIWMGMVQDFTLAPAHAHINLLGWVTMALYGLYHRGAGRPAGRDGRLAWAQAGSAALGLPLMTGGLAAYLATHDDALAPLVILGALLCLAGMLLFLAVVLADARAQRTARPGAVPAAA